MRDLKSHSFLRTNQFEVDNAFLGLEERFRVNHRDDLADALRERLDVLRRRPERWHPEILSLLLELSDQPTFKSDLSELDLLQKEEAPRQVAWRWEDIAEEDEWDKDDQIWKSINYSDESDDDTFEQQSSVESEDTSMYGDDVQAARSAESHIVVHEDQATFELVKEAQAWRKQIPSRDISGNIRKVAVSETQVIRDVLFMLQGLDCTLFDGNCVVEPSFQLDDMEWETYRAIMQTLTDFGSHLRTLRSFVRDRQGVPHLQAFQDCITNRLRNLDAKVSELQHKLASPGGETVLSLVRIKAELAAWLEPLYSLADIVSHIKLGNNSTPFRYLELIFDETCLAQLSGKTDLYEFHARIFAECFRVYLRPIRLWMDEGKLLSASDLFFVSESSASIPLGKTWRDRHELRRTADGTLHAPAFLRAAATDIYNAGKNIVVLKLLAKHDVAISQRNKNEPPLDYDAICPPGLELVPFSELFEAAFDRWIQSKYRATSTTLKAALCDDWGLPSTLQTLHNLYFMSDGSTAAPFVESIFSKLDDLSTDWSDRYLLTAAAQDSFIDIDPSRLTVTVRPELQQIPANSARDTVKTALGSINVQFRLSWPLQMVLTEDSMVHYQSLFTMLLRVRRATHSLHKAKILEHYWTDHENWTASAIFYATRTKLLWFCTTVQTYLTTLVLTPINAQMRRDMAAAHDMDAMIAVHDNAIKAMVDQACLGSRLAPIRECILDVFDLALQLERVRSGVAASEGTIHTSYEGVWREIRADVDRHVRFIWGGLRSVSRAAADPQSVKWDMLADMLQAGDVVEQ